MTDDALIAAMQRPEFYPHGPAEVTLVQTHISYVFLAGPEVYKVKKAVRFPFLDFSTLERRRFFCKEELRLNRRLAPDVYLEVVGIRHSDSGFRITAEDDPEAVEYAVHMRRLPSDRILTELLERGEATADLIDTLVDLLARFHAKARADDEVIAGGRPSSVARLLENNFSSARRFRGQGISAGDDDAIQAFSRRFLATNDALLRRRQDERRIRECHGDLHTEHVCCTDPVAIFDCIEFDAGLRNCDVAAEIAFLKMDLDYHDRADLADRLTSRYSFITGDADLLTLIPFYACYRAYVRGLVDSLTAAEQEVSPPEREAAAQRAKRHFDLAYRYTWATTRGLLVVCGLSGSGKSTMSEAIQRRTGFVHINTDLVRKRLAGIDPRARLKEDDAEKLYSPEMSARTYATMYAEASTALESGRAAIMDGTFQRRQDRDAARQLAARHRAPILIVECECDETQIHHRLTDRQTKGESPSDADWQIYLQQRRNREPIDHSEADVLRLDTARPFEQLIPIVEAAIRQRWDERG